MSKPTHSQSIRPILVLFGPIMILVAGFLGVISSSMIPFSPSEDLYDLRQRTEAARTTAASGEQTLALDRVADTLEAARLAIEHEAGRTWTLRSYYRAQSLLWKAERLLDTVDSSPSGNRARDTAPAG